MKNNSVVIFKDGFAFIYRFGGKITVHKQKTENNCYGFAAEMQGEIDLEENPETIADLNQIAKRWVDKETVIDNMEQITDIENKLMEVTDLLHEAESKFRNLPAEVQELIDEQAGGPGQFYDRVYSSRKNNERAGGAIEELKALIREGKL